MNTRTASVWATVFFVLLFAVPAVAAVGQAEPWQMGLQDAASPVMERIHGLFGLLTGITAAIVVFVFALLAYVMWQFNAKRNPTPSTRTHNTPLEIIWTVVPLGILAVIAVPSFNLLYYMDKAHDADMTVKATGHQWYWSYEYPDQGGIAFDAFMTYAEDLEPGQPRLLQADNAVVLPVDTDVRILTTSTDVIHSWAVPSLGIKTDSVPGRLNETWVRIEKPGTYYGQCSELCGVNHGFMPITIKAVPKTEFAAWVSEREAEMAETRENEPAFEQRMAEAE